MSYENLSKVLSNVDVKETVTNECQAVINIYIVNHLIVYC